MRPHPFSNIRLRSWAALVPAFALVAWAQPAPAQDSIDRAVLHAAAQLMIERNMVPGSQARVAFFLQDREPRSMIGSFSKATGQPAESTLAEHGYRVRKPTTFVELIGTALPTEVRAERIVLRRGRPEEMDADAGISLSPEAWVLDSGAVLVEVTLFYSSGVPTDNPRNYHTTVLMRLDEGEPGRWSVTDQTVVAR